MRHIARIEPPHIVVPVALRIQAPVLQVRQPQRVRPWFRSPKFRSLRSPRPKFDSKVLNTPPAPKAPKIIATNTFGGSSPAPTLQKITPARVQTGGFGDPNGVPANVHGSNRSNIATVGSFDLPAGGGHGNGSGGASGARGTVASVGFGNGVAAAERWKRRSGPHPDHVLWERNGCPDRRCATAGYEPSGEFNSGFHPK